MSADEDDYDFDDLAEFDEIEEEDDLADLDPEEEEEEEEYGEPTLPIEVVTEDDDNMRAVIGKPEAKAVTAPEPEPLGRDRSRKGSWLIATPATKTSEAIRRPLMSGHCAAPQTLHPEESHQRCRGYSRANPDKIFQPCPDLCHYPEERYECASCGGIILAAPHYPLDEDGDIRYVHLDTKRNRAADEECVR